MRSLIRAAALAAALIFPAPVMAQAPVRDSALPSASALTGSEKLRAAQGSGCATSVSPCASVTVTPVQIATYLGSSFQPLDSDLSAIAALSTSSFGRSLLTFPDAPSTRAAIGVAAIGGDTSYAFRSNNLSDLANPATARSNLGLGSLATQNGSFSGTSSGTNSGDQLISLTGDASGSGMGSFAVTLASVNTGPGSFGGPLTIPTITVNAKGLVTSSSSVALGTVPIAQGGSGSTTASAARTAFGVTATGADTTYAYRANNLSDLGSISTARGNLGAAASGANSDITSILGSAAKLTTARTFAISGDISWTVSFDGSSNVMAAGTLATVNANVGSCGGALAIPILTLDAKGRATACTPTTLGSMAMQSASAIAITGGTLNGVTSTGETIAPGTASTPALKFNPSSAVLNSTATSGALEVDANAVPYFTKADGVRRYITLGDTAQPTVAALSAAGMGATATVSATGSSGVITLVTGTAAVSQPDYVTLTYAHAYTTESYPVVSACNSNATAFVKNGYLTASKTGFTISDATVLAASTTFIFCYHAPGK